MTSDRDTAIAGLRAVLSLLERPDASERFLPLPAVALRLGLVQPSDPAEKLHAAVEHVRRELRDQLPVVRLSRTALVVREESLNEFIRKREALERRRSLKQVS